MKIKIQLKDPDWEILSDHEQTDEIRDIVSEYLMYSEYCTVEIDTDTKTAVVVKPK